MDTATIVLIIISTCISSLKVSCVVMFYQQTNPIENSPKSRASVPDMGGLGFEPGPQHTKVMNNGSGIASLLMLKQI